MTETAKIILITTGEINVNSDTSGGIIKFYQWWQNKYPNVNHRLLPAQTLTQIELQTGTIDYNDVDELLRIFRSCKWLFPEQAQLLIKKESWNTFRTYTLKHSDKKQCK